MIVGVLALQGAFIEHEQMLRKLGVSTVELRQKADLLNKPDALILPGGESTTQGKLLKDLEMFATNRIQGDKVYFSEIQNFNLWKLPVTIPIFTKLHKTAKIHRPKTHFQYISRVICHGIYFHALKVPLIANSHLKLPFII